MGANASTAVPVYASGEVLDAARLNLTNAGIPVFGGTALRDASFGGTGEKVLAEGQFAYLEDSNTTQYYDGAAWQTLVVSGLTLVKAQTIGTTVSSVEVTGAFSSTYDNYLVTVNGGVASASPIYLSLTLGATATGYYSFDIYGNYTSNTINGLARANATVFAAGGIASTGNIDAQIVIKNPNLAKTTTFISDNSVPATGVDNWVRAVGFLNNTTQYTAFTLTTTSGTLTGGTIRVYGYQNS